jgi:hypothetical protein
MTTRTTLGISSMRNGSLASAAMMSAALMITGCNDGGNGHASHAGATTGDTHAGQHAAGAHTHTTRLEFASAPATIAPGTPVTWTLRIVDAKSGAPVPDFSLSHEKLMHLIVVSTDLTWFNHIHPEYKGNGEFTVEAVLPRTGDYKLYADYTPKGGSQEVAQHELVAVGAAAGTGAAALVADTVGKGGWMVRSTVSRPEGEPEATGGGEYQVAMMPMPSKIVAGKDVMLHFQVRDADGTPLTDLEPYLGALGHAVLLSGDTKTYLHTHPMDGEMEGMDHGSGAHDHGTAAKSDGGSDVIFHTNFPTPGLYKVWGQFQHKGRIITAAFVLQVA